MNTTQTADGLAHEALMDTLRNTAVLADVSVGMWSGERSDAEAMDKIKADAGATGRVGRVVKYMMAGADTRLKQVKSAYSAVRLQHYALTLPWGDGSARIAGPRLLPNNLLTDYMNRLGDAQKAARLALDEFITHYDSDTQIAKANLGSLADLVYPAAPEVEGQFRITIDMVPLPSKQGFSALPHAFATQFAETLHTRTASRFVEAQEHAWEVVREAADALWQRLVQPEAAFRVNTVQRLGEASRLLRQWNLLRDPAMDQVCDALDELVPTLDAKQLRESAAYRQSTVDALERIAVLMPPPPTTDTTTGAI